MLSTGVAQKGLTEYWNNPLIQTTVNLLALSTKEYTPIQHISMQKRMKKVFLFKYKMKPKIKMLMTIRSQFLLYSIDKTRQEFISIITQNVKIQYI